MKQTNLEQPLLLSQNWKSDNYMGSNERNFNIAITKLVKG